jgi:hypothetical protein
MSMRLPHPPVQSSSKSPTSVSTCGGFWKFAYPILHPHQQLEFFGYQKKIKPDSWVARRSGELSALPSHIPEIRATWCHNAHHEICITTLQRAVPAGLRRIVSNQVLY